VLIAPHGMLDAWALPRHRWKKSPFASLEQQTWSKARCLHALSPLGGPLDPGPPAFAAPIAILPQWHPKALIAPTPRSTAAPGASACLVGERVLLFCACTREKVWPRLLKPWSRLPESAPERLVLAVVDRKSPAIASAGIDRRISIADSP